MPHKLKRKATPKLKEQEENVHALVLFLEDGVLHTTKIRKQQKRFAKPGSKLRVRWKDGGYYEAEILLMGNEDYVHEEYKKAKFIANESVDADRHKSELPTSSNDVEEEEMIIQEHDQTEDLTQTTLFINESATAIMQSKEVLDDESTSTSQFDFMRTTPCTDVEEVYVQNDDSSNSMVQPILSNNKTRPAATQLNSKLDDDSTDAIQADEMKTTPITDDNNEKEMNVKSDDPVLSLTKPILFNNTTRPTTIQSKNTVENFKKKIDGDDMLFDALHHGGDILLESSAAGLRKRLTTMQYVEESEDSDRTFDNSDIDPDYDYSDDSDSSDNLKTGTHISSKSAAIRSNVVPSIDTKVNNITNGKNDTDCPTANTEPVVLTTSNENQKRRWDKKYACVFCQKLEFKLTRHWERHHKDEFQIQKLMSLKKNSPQRNALIEELRNKGNFAHNNAVISSNSGIIIPVRRPSKPDDSSNYFPCSKCLGMFKKGQLWRHVARCKVPSEDKVASNGGRSQRHVQTYGRMMLEVSDAACKGLKENVLTTMKNDAISLAVRNDSLILKFGSKEYNKLGDKEHLWGFISQKMRELGRLLLGAREETAEITCLTDCINAVQFNDVIRAVKRICGYNELTHKYNIPSLALKLGHSLKKCAIICKTDAIKRMDEDWQNRAEQFTRLCEIEWTSEISTHALSNLHQKKWNNYNILPIADDLRKLNTHAQKCLSRSREAIKQDASKEIWDELCQVTLLLVILFNRKRSGEVSRMLISSFTEHIHNNDSDTDVQQSLSPFERKLAETLTLITIRGKRGKGVPVLLTPALKECIELLVDEKLRRIAGVHAHNRYIFARTNFGSLQPQRGTDVIRKFAKECGASKPELLTSTKMRKHIATMSQVANLNGTGLDCLASFMGHDVRVHREFYRLPQSTLYLAKVSKLLIAKEKGNIEDYKGKTLDEIHVDEKTVVSEEEDNGDISDEDSESTEIVEKEESPNEAIPMKSREYDIEDEMVKPRQTVSETKTKAKGQKKATRRLAWTRGEKDTVENHMKKFIATMKVPGKQDCEECIASNPILKKRDWKSVKFAVYNIIQSRKKVLSK